jgi:hypothetical protein
LSDQTARLWQIRARSTKEKPRTCGACPKHNSLSI